MDAIDRCYSVICYYPVYFYDCYRGLVVPIGDLCCLLELDLLVVLVACLVWANDVLLKDQVHLLLHLLELCFGHSIVVRLW